MDNNFGLALADFTDALQTRLTAHFANFYPNIEPPVVSVEVGSKNVKVITTQPGPSRSVFCFIRRADGAILKAAGWKGPAKHARGSIYTDDHGMSAVSESGAHYIK
jgi:hypothetical protein